MNLANAYLTSQKLPEAQAVINQLRNSQNPQVLTTVASMQAYLSQVQSSQQSSAEGSPVTLKLNMIPAK